MKYCLAFLALIAIVHAGLLVAHFSEDDKHVCPPCNHRDGWLKFHALVTSKDSGCMILETGIVTFKPHLKK